MSRTTIIIAIKNARTLHTTVFRRFTETLQLLDASYVDLMGFSPFIRDHNTFGPLRFGYPSHERTIRCQRMHSKRRLNFTHIKPSIYQ